MRDHYRPDLADPAKTFENRMPHRAAFIPYESEEKAVVAGAVSVMERPQSALVRSLDGYWHFHYAENAEAAVKDFMEETVDVTRWDLIPVPSSIQFQGYDRPQYVNTQYPWDGHEAVSHKEIPLQFNPVGQYVKTFALTEEDLADEKQIRIRFEGAESCIAIWLNGQYVGYASDSFMAKEFDLTPYVRAGINRLACEVTKWNIGSHFEDQDFFRLSGIYRSVNLMILPKVRVEDFTVKTIFGGSEAVKDPVPFDGSRASLVAKIRAQGAGAGIRARLSDADGKLVTEVGAVPEADGTFTILMEVLAPHLWSAEDPYLYSLLLLVSDADGALTEAIPVRVGFREFRLRKAVMELNGRRIIFHGANRHDFSAVHGRAVQPEEVYQDLILMKQSNINAIRTSHYPDVELLYDLADELGLYLIAENNMETHGTWTHIMTGEHTTDYVLPWDDETWKPLLLDRIDGCYTRDRNHPAVLIWSVGNESLGGTVIRDMAARFRELDPTRLVHYESVANDPRYPETTDITSRMYPPVSWLREFLSHEENRNKPFLFCEYTHSMGNSNGGMQLYTDYMEEEPLFQGAFIWDYIDQSIYKKDRYGNWVAGYGGDFQDRPHDGNFSGNGVALNEVPIAGISSYGNVPNPRIASPKMQEVKACYQGLRIQVEPQRVLVRNAYLFTNTDAFRCEEIVLLNGREICRKELQTSVAPGETAMYALPVTEKELLQNPLVRMKAEACIREDGFAEFAATISFTLKEDVAYAKAGHEVAFGQGMISTVHCGKTEEKVSESPADAAFRIIYGDDNIGVRGENFHVLFSKQAGLVSYVYGGRELLEGVVRPNFWRAPTDNDRGNGMPARQGIWRLVSDDMRLSRSFFGNDEGVKTEERPEGLAVTYTYLYPVGADQLKFTLTYLVAKDGTVTVTMETPEGAKSPEELGLPDPPEFGVLFRLSADYDRLSWYGNGPEENYEDRKYGARLGRYQNLVADNMAAYLVPQECGNKTDVRFAEVTDIAGRGLRFMAGRNGSGTEMDFSALPYTPNQLQEAAHPNELPPVLATIVRASMMQMGVGGDDSWGAPVLPQYHLPKTGLRFTMSFKGI